MAGKLANVEREMDRLNIDILGLSEVRWPGTGKMKTNSGYIYYSGGTDNNHRYGTAILITDEVEKAVLDYVPLNDRVMLLRLQTSHRIMNILQVYAPTKDKSEAEIEEFYNKVDDLMKLTKKGEITIVMGDLNAKVGTGTEGESVGAYGLGERNSGGDRLVQFCNENNLFVTNTFFKQHPRRLYTWIAPADNQGRIVRNQIDFIMMRLELKKYVKSVKTYPGADINSDHIPVVMDFRMKRFKKVKREPTNKQVDIEKLNDSEIHEEIGMKLEKELRELNSGMQMDSETVWGQIKDAIIKIQEQEIGFKECIKRKEWMTDEILELMSQRRVAKSTPVQYKELNKIIRKKCREAKEKWLAEKCTEIEELQQKHDSFNVHKKVKEIAEVGRKRQIGILRSTNNEIIIGVEEKLKRWKSYVEELFNDDRHEIPRIASEHREDGPAITKSEVIHAIKTQKNRKATGADKVHMEVLKTIATQEGKGLDLMLELFNTIYRTGKIPPSWLKSTFVTIPKKTNASQCDDYRMISLMSHILKVFLRIIHTRIYKKCEEQISDTQFGFQNGLGTREALFSLNVLAQRCRDMNIVVYACFIDYRKAFDRDKHQKMIEILSVTGIDKRDITLIANLYWNQIAEVRIDGRTSDTVSIRRGVRQGCILSPLLFNIYSEAIFKEALTEVMGGIKINGVCITNIRYADDTVVLADNISDLQNMMNRITEYSEHHGLDLNISKTKLLVFSKRPTAETILINGNQIEQVSCFKYMGTIVNEWCDPKRVCCCTDVNAGPWILQLKRKLRCLKCTYIAVCSASHGSNGLRTRKCLDE